MKFLNITLSVLILIGAQTTWAKTKRPRKPSNSSNVAAVQTVKPSASFGVSVEPVWLLLSGLGAKFEYFASESYSIGIGGIYIPEHTIESTTQSDTSSPHYNYRWSYSEINLGTNIMLSGTTTTNGAYINPAIGYRTARITEYSDLKLQGSASAPHLRLTSGYQWVNKKNPLRIAVGGGLALIQATDVVVKDDSGREVIRQKSSDLGGLALDLHLGFMF